MADKVKYIPEGYHTITPYLSVEGADNVIVFLLKAFNAEEVGNRVMWPDGTILHAELKVGDSRIMLSEARGEWKPSPASMYIYVEDVDAVYQRALEAGASSIMAPENMFYGDRHGAVRDPGGNTWMIATRVEQVSEEEMQRRTEEFLSKMPCEPAGTEKK